MSKTAKPQARTVMQSTLSLRFPNQPIKMVGSYTSEECALELQDLAGWHRGLMKVLSGQVIKVSAFELKVKLGEIIFQHGLACSHLIQRCSELGKNLDLPEPTTHFKALLSELELSRNDMEFIALMELLERTLRDKCRTLLNGINSICDAPTVRILNQIISDLESTLGWIAEIRKLTPNEVFRQNVSDDWWSVVRSYPERSEHIPVPEEFRQHNETYTQPTACARDGRFETFKHTRDYNKTQDFPAPADSEYRVKLIELVRTQRDEIDAIETFANVLYGVERAPFQFELDMCRFIWDEARHAQLGHEAILEMGVDPFSVPCNILGINVRAPLAPLDALGAISLFGELNIVKEMKRFSGQAYKANDRTWGILFDLIHRDEVLHLRLGRKWLKAIGEESLAELESRLRRITSKRLEDEGVLDEDYEVILSSEEITQIIGGE